MELKRRGIGFTAQTPLRIKYKDELLRKEYIADLICDGPVLVELKAMDQLTSREEAQLLNYLKATGIKVGVLINFGRPKLEWKRLVR